MSKSPTLQRVAAVEAISDATQVEKIVLEPSSAVVVSIKGFFHVGGTLQRVLYAPDLF
jgi:hypothetical protein